MIRYQLVCDAAHEFESWFASSEAYDKQDKATLLECPFCGSSRVSKALMAPQVARKDQPDSADTALLDPRMQALREAMVRLREHVTRDGVNVGGRFAEEARKIHNGESDARTIYGQTTGEEARELLEEGVPILPLPDLAEERH